MVQVKLSYVVVGWNNKKFLKSCLDSILDQVNVKKSIYYIDNNSSDDSVMYVEQHYPMVKIIQNSDNLGFAKANNIGIKQALKDNAEYIVLLNTDAELTPNWSYTIVNFAEKNPKGACFQGTTLRKNEKGLIDSTGIFLDKKLVATQINYLKEYTPPYGNCEVFGVNAAAALYTKNFLEKQPFKDEYFDEDFFMYLEDVDLCLRAIELGWKNYFVSNAKAFHVGSASSKSQSFGFKLSYRNHSAMLFKNFSIGFIIKKTPRLIASDIERIIGFYRNKQKDVSLAIITGRLQGIWLIHKMFKKRRYLVKQNKKNLQYIISFMPKGYITLGK